MQAPLLWPLACYLLLIFAVAWGTRYYQASSSFLKDYLIGNRRLGSFMLAMTLSATYVGASSFIGGPGAAYQMGLGWVLLAMIQVPVAWLTLGVLGKKFAIEARRCQALTINDFLYARYQNRAVVLFASVALVCALLAMMVASFVGGARLLQTVTGLSYTQGLMIFASVVACYTLWGGFRAVVFTDSIQGLMMLVGTLLLLAGVIHSGNGLTALMAKLQTIDGDLVMPYGPKHQLSPLFMFSFWILVCFAMIGLPTTAVRCMAYKNSRSMHQAMVLSTFVISFLMFGLHLAGALGRAIIPELHMHSSDQILPALMMQVLSPSLAGIFLAGPMAAMMSSVDSLLIQTSGTLISDLYLNYLRRHTTHHPPVERKIKQLSFLVTGVCALLVFCAALQPPAMIIWLSLAALGALQAVFLWPLVLGLYWQNASSTGALCSMASGLLSYLCLLFIKPQWSGLHPIVPSLTIALIAFILGSLARPHRVTNHTALTKES